MTGGERQAAGHGPAARGPKAEAATRRRRSSQMTRSALAAAIITAALLISTTRAASPIPAMLLDGESGGTYHDWQHVTPVLKKMLDETGLFATTVVTTPPAGADFSGFAPDFSKFQVVVMNYDAPDERWPAALKTSFERFVTNGGGFVSVHAADNAFPEWAAFNEMIGLGGWNDRNEKSGPYLRLRDGAWKPDTTPGRGGSHGKQHAFLMITRAPGHPIMRGLPEKWMHAKDELYDRLRGPAQDLTVLASAFSAKEQA